MAAKRGPENARWKGGVYLNSNGYLRVSAGPDRGKYVHRTVTEKNLGGPLPPGYEIHHMDFCRTHNCPENLLILGPGLHDPITRDSVRARKKVEQDRALMKMLAGAGA